MFQTTKRAKFFYFRLLTLILLSAKAQQAHAYQAKQSKPPLQLATKYQRGVFVGDYWVSEKLDGVRGYWNGQQLSTRNGIVLSPPPWFIKNWPNITLDGELYSARGEFEQISACVRRKKSDGECWNALKLMIFDLPHLSGNFSSRITAMQRLIDASHSPYLSMVEQYKIANNRQLHRLLNDIVDNNGEGLMLHLADAEHQYGRSQNLLKLKKYQDAEAKVIAHVPGKGKYKNLLGAIQVITPEGIRFKIGSGFSDLQRKQPPKIGSTITYKYIGKTQRGVPRFASFLRMSNQH